MKKLAVLLVVVCLLIPAIAVAQTEGQVIASFKKITERVDGYFSSPKIVPSEYSWSIYSEKHPAFCLFKYEKSNIAYDIEKTSSLISPFIGYINISFKSSSNAKSGDVKFYGKDPITGGRIFKTWGFSSLELANKNEIFGPCDIGFESEEIIGDKCESEIKILFSYQEEKWVLKSIDGPIGTVAKETLKETMLKKWLVDII